MMSEKHYSKPAVSLFITFFLCALLLCGCGPVACDFCGRTKFCKEFDILGVTRHICNDCLNDPRIAISGNMVRIYSEMYENGSLEYPEGSPLRPDSDKNAEASPTVSQNRTIEDILNEEIVINNPVTPDTYPVPVSPDTPAASPASSESSSGGLSGAALISSLNGNLADDNMSLAAIDGRDGEYRLLCGGNDTCIRFITASSDTAGKDKLTIELREGASSSDYVKSVIRSVLSYTGSDDYEGLGHEIFNRTIQNGSYTSEGIRFISKVHTADEVEKGAAISDFTIQP